MIEYNDGSIGKIQSLADAFQEAQDDPNVACVHVGTTEKLMALKKQLTDFEERELSDTVKYYGETMMRIEEKLDRIIKHFNIIKIIGS